MYFTKVEQLCKVYILVFSDYVSYIVQSQGHTNKKEK